MKGAVFYVKGSAFFMLSVITLVPLNSEHYRHIALLIDIDYALREKTELGDNGKRRECERHERIYAFINA